MFQYAAHVKAFPLTVESFRKLRLEEDKLVRLINRPFPQIVLRFAAKQLAAVSAKLDTLARTGCDATQAARYEKDGMVYSAGQQRWTH